MKLTAALVLVLLILSLILSPEAQQSRPIPGIQTTTALGGTVNTSAVPSMGAPVFDLKNFSGPGKRTAAAAIGTVYAAGTGEARARLHGMTPYFELIGSGYALGRDPIGGTFVNVSGGFAVPAGAVAHVVMLGSIEIERGPGSAAIPLMNAMVTDGTTSQGIDLDDEGTAFRHVVLPAGAYSVTGNLNVGGVDNYREEAAFHIVVSLQYLSFAPPRGP